MLTGVHDEDLLSDGEDECSYYRRLSERLANHVLQMETALLKIVVGNEDVEWMTEDYLVGYRDGQDYQSKIASDVLGQCGPGWREW